MQSGDATRVRAATSGVLVCPIRWTYTERSTLQASKTSITRRNVNNANSKTWPLKGLRMMQLTVRGINCGRIIGDHEG